MEAAQGLEEFVAIVDSGSISAAAQQLGLPRPTVSRRLARLEERLGVRLLRRTTRRLAVTPQGKLLYARARHLVQATHALTDEVRRLDGVPRGRLRVALPLAMSHDILASWLAEFLHRHTEVDLEVMASADPAGHVTRGVDVAVHRGPLHDTALITRTIALDDSVAVASPEYLDDAPPLRVPDDLEDQRCILGFRGPQEPVTRWPLHGGGWIGVTGRFRSDQSGLRLAAARQHLGIAMVSRYEAHDLLASGELVQVLAGQLGLQETVHLVYAEREFLDPKIRAFVDFFVEQVAARGR